MPEHLSSSRLQDLQRETVTLSLVSLGTRLLLIRMGPWEGPETSLWIAFCSPEWWMMGSASVGEEGAW